MSFFSSTVRLAATWLVAATCLALAACYREATDASAATTQARYAGHEPWTVDGVRPGQTLAEIKQVLGEPRETRESMGQHTVFWSSPRDITCTFDQSGRATEILGTSLKAGPKTLVWASSSEDEVGQILGPGKVQKSYRPKGSGVISLGQEHAGTTLVYDNGDVRFEIIVFGAAAGHIRAYRQP